MRFDEAFKELVDNQNVLSRKAWDDKSLEFNMISKEFILCDADVIKSWIPNQEDLTATDWEVL